jgi:hypothetical protein
MDEHDWLAQRFEEHRAHLRAVAYRMLGSPSEAEEPCRKPGCASVGPVPTGSRTSEGG